MFNHLFSMIQKEIVIMKKSFIKLFSALLALSVFSTPVFAEDSHEPEVRLIDSEIEKQSDNSFTQTSTYEIIIPANKTGRSYTTKNDRDSTISMEATLTSTYVANAANNAILLTGVSGSWKPLDSRTSIKSARLVYGCSSISLVTQTGTKYPTSSPFSYSTGFSKYVAKNGGSEVGSRLTLTLARGGSTWNFTLTSSVISNNLGLF